MQLPPRSSPPDPAPHGSSAADLREQQQEVGKERRAGRVHTAKSSAREGGRRCTCVSHEGGDAAELRLREGGRCGGAASACVKQGGEAAALRQRGGAMCAVALLCVREMRDELRRDKDTLVGCLLDWANHSLYICHFLVFLFFPFSLFLA
jgi:hypothetical protein